MGDKIKQAPAKVKGFFSKLSKGMKILIGVVVALMIAAIIGLVVMRMNDPYTILFTDLTSDDMSKVLNYLDGNNIRNYKVQDNDTILVPTSQEPSIKAALLREDYPVSGFGYSRYLDNVNALASESDRRRLFLFDLQDRLSSVVRCFDGVKDARVTITEGSDHRYILNQDDVVEASASVFVTMKSNQVLTAQQARGIRNLIRTAVEGLSIENIEISDGAGNTYSGDDDGVTAATDASQLKLDLERKVNESVRSQILDVLIPMYGSDNVSVAVNSTVDVSRTYTDSTTYNQPAWAADGSTDGRGIIGRRIYDNRVVAGGDQAAGGIAGTSTNADLNEYVESYRPNGNEQELGSAGEIDYENDRTQTQREIPAGVVTDCSVSVSINSNAVTVPNVNNLIAHIARAAGIDAAVQNQKVSVLLSPFYVTPPVNEDEDTTSTIGGLPRWALYALIGGLILFFLLLLLIILLVSRRRKKKRQAEEEAAAEAERLARELAALQAANNGQEGENPPGEGADIMDIHTERSMELRKTVRQFAENNPELAAQMIRTWMKEDDGNS